MDRKEQIRRYKETPRTAGIYRVLNSSNAKFLVGASVDAPAMLNRQRAQLRMGSHPNRALQSDWDSDGDQMFIFEVLDALEPEDSPDYDPAEDLQALEELWREKLGVAAGATY